MPTTRTSSGRASTGRTDSATKIADATLELLRSHGPSAVTIEGVAALSGVARTTIYRRYTDRNAMLTGALHGLTLGDQHPPQDGSSGAQRLRWVVDRAASILVDGIGCGGLAALLTDADPAFTAEFRSVLQTHREAMADALRAGVDDGTLALRGDIETTVDSIVGSLVTEHARTGTVADDWADRIMAVHSCLIVDE